jgi:hypothetical protein
MSKGKSALNIVRKYHPNVTSVVDAKKTISVAVTARDCKGGNQKKPNSCAMARAFEREYDGAVVSLAVAYLVNGNQATRYRVPSSVARELVSFDRSKVFAPGKYSLCAPSSTEKLAAVRQRSRISNAKRAKNGANATTARHTHKTAGIRAL